ncbi:MAG: hypothetical protein R3F61_36260 [Myxococcota bacterium]
MMVLLSLLATAGACDVPALEALAADLAPDTPLETLGPKLAALCPRPLGLQRALRKPGDPLLDVNAAVTQAASWEETCPAGLDAIPDGFAPATAGERQALWTGCDLERFQGFELHEWLGTDGPAVSVVVLAQVLTKAGVSKPARTTLVRAWARIPPPVVETEPEARQLGDDDPLAGFRETAPPRAVTLARVAWPPNTEPGQECLVEVEVLDEGTPGRVLWVTCPEELQSYVQSAIEASWFQPGRRRGQPMQGTVRLRYSTGSRSPEAEVR